VLDTILGSVAVEYSRRALLDEDGRLGLCRGREVNGGGRVLGMALAQDAGRSGVRDWKIRCRCVMDARTGLGARRVHQA
jgi:hypothetical protein